MAETVEQEETQRYVDSALEPDDGTGPSFSDTARTVEPIAAGAGVMLGDVIIPDLCDSNPAQENKNDSSAAHAPTRKQTSAAVAAAQLSSAGASPPSAGGPGQRASEIRRMLVRASPSPGRGISPPPGSAEQRGLEIKAILAGATPTESSRARTSNPVVGGTDQLTSEIRATLAQQKRPASEISSTTTMTTALRAKEKEGTDRIQVQSHIRRLEDDVARLQLEIEMDKRSLNRPGQKMKDRHFL